MQWTSNTHLAATQSGVARANNMRVAALVVAILLWFPIGIFCGIAGFRMSGRARAASASGDEQTATRLLNRVRALLIVSVATTAIWGIAWTAYFVSQGNH
jgi:hypothetical protein